MCLLDATAHSMYCNDEKERKRVGALPCARCLWDLLKAGKRISNKKASELWEILEQHLTFDE